MSTMQNLKLLQELEAIKHKLAQKKASVNKKGEFLETAKHLLDRRIINSLLPQSQLTPEKFTENLDENFTFFFSDSQFIVIKKSNFVDVKNGFFTSTKLSAAAKNGVIKMDPKEYQYDHMKIIFEYIRTKKLENIGIPQTDEGKKSLLQSVTKVGGFDDLEKRLKILIFVNDLNSKGADDEAIKIRNEIFLMKGKLKKLSERDLKINSSIDVCMSRISELEKKLPKKTVHIDESNVVRVNVGGKLFKCPMNKSLEVFAGSKLHTIIKTLKKNGRKISDFIDRSPDAFEKIHSFIYSPYDFTKTTCKNYDEEKFLNAEFLFYLSVPSPLRYPIETLGYTNLQMKVEEDFIRNLFITDRSNKVLSRRDILLMSLFDNIGKFKKCEKVGDIPLLFDIENSPKTFLKKHRSIKLPPMLQEKKNFKNNFNIFTSGLLEGLDYSNIFIAGGSILANVLDYSAVKKTVKKIDGKTSGKLRKNEMEKESEKIDGEIDPSIALHDLQKREKLIDLDMELYGNDKYAHLLDLPMSSMLIKRLLQIQAKITSFSQFNFNTNMKYNSHKVCKSLQLFRQLSFYKNSFIYQCHITNDSSSKVIFSFITGSKLIPNVLSIHKKLPNDYYPICISHDSRTLIYALLNENKDHHNDFKVYISGIKDASFPMKISQFIMHMKIEKDSHSHICESTRNYKIITNLKQQARYFGKSDIDIFLYSVSKNEAVKKIEHIYEIIKKNLSKQKKNSSHLSTHCLIIRTAYSLTFQFHQRRPIQIVLRIYKSPTEILCGFDIDSCTIGYDGMNVLCLPRFHRAYTKRYNLIDNERMSTTYALRLSKYAKRGFRIAVPNFSHDLIKREGLCSSVIVKTKSMKNAYRNPEYITTMGLARLLLLEQRLKKKSLMKFRIIQKSDYESDYLMVPARLRRANPIFVAKLMKEKEKKMKEKFERLMEYANLDRDKKWLPGMAYSVNDIEMILKSKKIEEETSLKGEIDFLIENPGTQKKITSSFNPIEINFFEDAYCTYNDLVSRRWKKNLGTYMWWYSLDNGKSVIEFTQYASDLIEGAFNRNQNTLKTKGFAIDFDEMIVVFIGKENEDDNKKYKIYRMKDFKIPS